MTSLRDTKVEKGLQNTTKYDEAISKVEECFNNWTDDKNAIALTIYLQIIGEKKFAGLSKIKLSKTLIAKNFVQIIEETEIQKENLENDQNVTYLLDAVKHVTQD